MQQCVRFRNLFSLLRHVMNSNCRWQIDLFRNGIFSPVKMLLKCTYLYEMSRRLYCNLLRRGSLKVDFSICIHMPTHILSGKRSAG